MQTSVVSGLNFYYSASLFVGRCLRHCEDAKALALGIGDSRELGLLWPGIQKKSTTQAFPNALAIMPNSGICIRPYARL